MNKWLKTVFFPREQFKNELSSLFSPKMSDVIIFLPKKTFFSGIFFFYRNPLDVVIAEFCNSSSEETCASHVVHAQSDHHSVWKINNFKVVIIHFKVVIIHFKVVIIHFKVVMFNFKVEIINSEVVMLLLC